MEKNMRISRLSGTLLIGLLAGVSVAESYAADTVPCRRHGRIRECAVVPLARPADDRTAKAFDAPVADGRAGIYVVRPYTQEPLQVSKLYVDGIPAAVIAPNTYAYIDVTSGSHTITVHTYDDTKLELAVEAGRRYYLRYQLDLLFSSTPLPV
jgi:hypothetical protein